MALYRRRDDPDEIEMFRGAPVIPGRFSSDETMVIQDGNETQVVRNSSVHYGKPVEADPPSAGKLLAMTFGLLGVGLLIVVSWLTWLL